MKKYRQIMPNNYKTCTTGARNKLEHQGNGKLQLLVGEVNGQSMERYNRCELGT
jgi:hypothetical protein